MSETNVGPREALRFGLLLAVTVMIGIGLAEWSACGMDRYSAREEILDRVTDEDRASGPTVVLVKVEGRWLPVNGVELKCSIGARERWICKARPWNATTD